MGCDIHWHTETYQNDVWVCDQVKAFRTETDYGQTDKTMDDFIGGDRNYALFGLLADGVRTEYPFSFVAIGLPDDLSESVRFMVDQLAEDGHNHSHLTRSELEDKITELNFLATEALINPNVLGEYISIQELAFLQDDLEVIVNNMKQASPGQYPEDQRLVFWFDN